VPDRANQGGFTLIEILVVVVIVAVVASIAVLSLGILGDDRELRTEVRRLISLVEVAQDEAMLQGREFGLEVMTGSYRFVEYDAFTGQWTELFGDDVLRLRQLPEGMEFELYLDGQRIVLDADPASTEDPAEESRRDLTEDYAPHVFVYSSGDMTPFELRLLRPDLEQTIAMRAGILGTLEVVDEDE
jgi:general secretion pathway protein H